MLLIWMPLGSLSRGLSGPCSICQGSQGLRNALLSCLPSECWNSAGPRAKGPQSFSSWVDQTSSQHGVTGLWCLALSPCFESHLKSLHHIPSVCCMLLFTVPARFKERWGMSLHVGLCQSQGAEEHAGRRHCCCRHWKMLPAPTCQSSNASPFFYR